MKNDAPAARPGETQDRSRPKEPGAFSSIEREIARRYLGAKKSGIGVSLISSIAFFGILLAVAVLIIVMSVMQGFRTELLGTLLGVKGHVYVESYEGIEDYDAVADRLAAVEGVTRAAPLIEAPVYVTAQFGETGAVVRSLSRDDVLSLDYVRNGLFDGSLDAFGVGEKGGVDVLVAARLARRLGVRAGDPVTLVTGGGPETPFGRAPLTSKTYRVGGVFEIGLSELDEITILMPLQQGQLFFRTGDAVRAIEILVEDPEAEVIDRYLPAIRAAAPEGSAVYDWRDTNASFFAALGVERSVMRLILSLIILIASLNIISGLVMLVKDKTGDIAVLRTLGATQGAVMRIFILSGSLIGVAATVAGVVLGALFCVYISEIEQALSTVFGPLWQPDVYFLSEIPAELQFGETAFIALFALASSFLATLYPSWRAARLDPVEALRYE